MIANWAVGQEADPFQVAEQLNVAPFDCVIITMTTAVAETTPVAKSFRTLWDTTQQHHCGVDLNEVVQDHTVLRLQQRI